MFNVNNSFWNNGQLVDGWLVGRLAFWLVEWYKILEKAVNFNSLSVVHWPSGCLGPQKVMHLLEWDWGSDFPSGLLLNYQLHRDYLAELAFPSPCAETSRVCKTFSWPSYLWRGMVILKTLDRLGTLTTPPWTPQVLAQCITTSYFFHHLWPFDYIMWHESCIRKSWISCILANIL